MRKIANFRVLFQKKYTSEALAILHDARYMSWGSKSKSSFRLSLTLVCGHIATNRKIDVFGVRFFKNVNFSQVSGSGWWSSDIYFHIFSIRFFSLRKWGTKVITNKKVTEKSPLVWS